jgi:hypothetical protein
MMDIRFPSKYFSFAPVPPDALRYAQTLLDTLRWEGWTMVEFEMDLADQTPCGKILLCSPFSGIRLPGSLTLSLLGIRSSGGLLCDD